ncbi:MAG: WD40 repeat domain-containing protein [Aliishimia sp.]
MQGSVATDGLNPVSRVKTELEQRGERFSFGVPVTGAVSVGDHVAVSFGDGRVCFFHPENPVKTVDAHRGVVLCIAADGDHVLTGGDDGRFLRVSSGGDLEELAQFGTRWVDCVAASDGYRACSSGRQAHVWVSGDAKATIFEHVSTVGGLAFDKGGQRLAVTYYGGATVWGRKDQGWTPSKLFWKGFHGDTCFSPDGKYLVTSMQENALHAWRLRDNGDFAMSGYPAKIKSLTWVGDIPHLVTSGADEAIAWPFDGKNGPLGREPVRVAYNDDNLVTCVQSLPQKEAVFVGFSDGTVQLAELDETKGIVLLSSATGADVISIVVSTSLSHLMIGDAKGNVLWAPLKKSPAHW